MGGDIRRKFDKEFKFEAVRSIIWEGRRSIAEVARNLVILISILH